MAIFRKATICCLVITACCLTGRSDGASTFDVAAGYDLFHTDSSQTTFPGLGNLMGVPLGTYDFGGAIGVQNTGNTDTIIQRTGAATGPGPATVPLVMDALQLETVAPVSFGGGPVGFYFVTLQSARGGPATTGSLTVSWDGTGLGGTFSSTLDVYFDIRFGSLVGPIVFSDNLPLSQTGAAWTDLPPAGSVLITGVNQFLSGTAGDPTMDFWPGGLIETHPSGAQHAVDAASAQVPELTSAASFGLLMAAAAIVAKRRKRK